MSQTLPMDRTLPPDRAVADPTHHPAMRRFAAAVRALYGARVERIVLFGSRARGDARDDSDWDVAVFLRDLGDWWADIQRLNAIGDAILWETGCVISPKPFAKDARDPAPLLRAIERDGRAL